MGATIRDVAKEAGVSIATVSRTLNGSTAIAPATKAAVLAAADKIGYQRDRVAAAMRTGRTNSIGLVIGEIMDPFYATLAHCVERFVKAQGSALVIANARFEAQSQLEAVQTLVEQRVDGLLLVPTPDDSEDWHHRYQPPIPTVALDRKSPSDHFVTVVVDSAPAVSELAQHILAQGYRRPAYISGPMTTSTWRARRDQMQRAFAEVGLPLLVEEGPADAAGGAEAARSLLALHSPDVLICTGNQMVAGILKLARAKNLTIGRDLGLAAVDDVPLFSAMTPTITVIDQPIDKLAQLGVALLGKMVNGAAYCPQPGQVIVAGNANLIIRESTAGPGVGPVWQQPA